MAKKKKEYELWFVAECKTLSGGEPRSISVYQKGQSYLMQGPDLHRIPCHSSVHTEAEVKREIALVYKVEVLGIKYLHELDPA